MKIENPELYEIYKPLRNYLRQFGIENGLYIIWAYINHFQFNHPFPNDILVHPNILNAKDIPSRGVYEWELALLAREIITNGQDDKIFATKSFNRWDHLHDAINKIKDFENNAYPIISDDISDVLKELRRISHRQFPWQLKQNIGTSQFIRYFKIYNNPRIADIIKNKIGLSVHQWYLIGTAITGAILSHTKMNLDPEITISDITKKHFDIFLSLTSVSLDGIREIIDRDVKLDDEFVYTFNPLEYYPLISIGQYYYCPIINFLLWRTTSGLYFDVVDDPRFGDPYGKSFQDYIEEISLKILNPKITNIIPEQKYKANGNVKDSIDFIISQKNSAIFCEAKTKRISTKSKSQLISNEAIDKDLDVLARDITQAYLTFEDYRKNYYNHFPYKKDIKIFILLTTLDEWYLMGEDLKNLDRKVRDCTIKKGLDTKIVDDFPFAVCSTVYYEYLMQVLNNHPIEEIMQKWFVPEKNGYEFNHFITTEYNKELKNLEYFFPEDFEKIYPTIIFPKKNAIV